MTLTNMAIEAGGKNGVCDVDEKTLAVRPRPLQPPELGSLHRRRGRDVRLRSTSGTWPRWSRWSPSPTRPDNKDTAHNCRDVKLDRAYIGSCTGGKITDMIFAANILKGNKVKIPTFVVPGSTEVHADMKTLNLRGVPEGHEREEHRGRPASTPAA